MDKVYSYLMDWSINFIKNRDILTKKISDIKKKELDFSVVNKDRTEIFYFIILSIENISEILKKTNKNSHFGIFTLNNKKNLIILINNWEKLIEFEYLGFYFINPFSKLDEKWVIFPYTHHRICDPDSLQTGLRTMSEMVDEITEDQLKEKLR